MAGSQPQTPQPNPQAPQNKRVHAHGGAEPQPPRQDAAQCLRIAAAALPLRTQLPRGPAAMQSTRYSTGCTQAVLLSPSRAAAAARILTGRPRARKGTRSGKEQRTKLPSLHGACFASWRTSRDCCSRTQNRHPQAKRRHPVTPRTHGPRDGTRPNHPAPPKHKTRTRHCRCCNDTSHHAR